MKGSRKMNINEIIEEIKLNLTGDPQKDGPFLKEQSEKYKDTDISEELDREFAKIIYEITKKEYEGQLNAFLEAENQKVPEKLAMAQKRYDNLNFNGGMKIVEEIINNNIAAWNDTSEVTYKCFGTPLERMLYLGLYEPDKKILPVNCNLAGAYRLYCFGLMQKKKYQDAFFAIERALELNPVDPEVNEVYIELMKQINDMPRLKEACKRLLGCAVTKKQISNAYFGLSYYYSEERQYEKAMALLQMCRIFHKHELYESELKYISDKLGLGSVPQRKNPQELMEILNKEKIQPGPSSNVIQTAYFLAKRAEEQLDFQLAKYYYEIVWELTEDEDVSDRIQEISNTLKDLKMFNS